MRGFSTLIFVVFAGALCSCKSQKSGIKREVYNRRSQLVKRPLAILGNTAQNTNGLEMLDSHNPYPRQMFFNPYNADEITTGPIGGIMSGPNGIQGATGVSQGKLYSGTSDAGVVAGSMIGDRRGMVDTPPMAPIIVDSDAENLNVNSNNNIDPSDDKVVMGDPSLFNKMCNVLRLRFEANDGDRIYDSSEQNNEVYLKDGATLTAKGIITGKAVNLGDDGKVYVGSKFRGKPKKSVAISLWVKLENLKGEHSLFRASDLNNVVHYELSSQNGKVSWAHRSDNGNELFRVQTDSPVLKERQWQHIVGVYDNQNAKASLWIDGKKIREKNGIIGQLAQKWSLLSVFGGRTKGFMDNIQLFRCPLDRTKVVALYVASASPKENKKSLVEKPHHVALQKKKSTIKLSEKLKNF